MIITMHLENIPTLAIIGAALLVGLLLVRLFVKYAWKFVRVALIVIAILVVLGYFTPVLDIVIR